MALSQTQIIAWLKKAAEELEQNKNWLTELDAAIGDADHGINMERGFKKVLEKLPGFENQDIGQIFKNTGMALISSVGGASGPLYGTFFMQAASPATSKMELSLEELHDSFSAGMNGIKSRGRAAAGEKTMIDAWEPALMAMQEHQDHTTTEALQAAVEAAEQGVRDTINMMAQKGRASYLGERSVGHQDPGATSTTILLKALQQVATE